MARPTSRPAGAPKYSDVCMRLFRKHEGAKEIEAAKAFHITFAAWSYILDKEYIQKVRDLRWRFQGSMNGVTNNAQFAMQDRNGKPRLDHFQKPGRYWADMQNEAYRKWYVDRLQAWVDAGADAIQRDEPTTCKRTPIPVAAAFFKDVHARFAERVGRHVPMSCNLAWNNSRFGGRGEPVARLFDYGMAEVFGRHVDPVFFREAAADASTRGKTLVFTGGKAMDLRAFRLAVAGCYANGMQFIVPWDQFAGIGKPRVFAKPQDLADLYGFVRGVSGYLDGYEAAWHFSAERPPFAQAHLTKTAFTVFLVSRSDDAAFGLCGNAEHGGGGIPRLYLQRGGFTYNRPLDSTLRIPTEPGRSEITMFIHNGKQTIQARVNGGGLESRSDPLQQAQAAFGGGGHLSVPQQGGNRNHAGDLAEVIIYRRALTQAEQQAVYGGLAAKYLRLKTDGLAPDDPSLKSDLILWLKAEDLAKTHKDGDPVRVWPAATGQRAVVPNVRMPDGKRAAPPTLKTDAVNGRSAVRFDGVDDLLRIESGESASTLGRRPLVVYGGTGKIDASIRAKPGYTAAPVVVHLVEWGAKPTQFTVALHPTRFFHPAPLRIRLLTPTPYNAEAHEKAVQTKDYSALAASQALLPRREGGAVVVDVPPLSPWGVLVIEPAAP